MHARAVLLALALVLAAPQAHADSGTFVHVSDIHFNPFDPPLRARALAGMPIEDWPAFFARDPDQTLASWGEDTNHALLATSLDALARASADADFVLVTGDLIAHRFEDNVEDVLGFPQGSAANAAFAVRTTLFVAERLRAAAPGKPVFVSLGNNDSSCGDYRIDPGGTYLAATREAVRNLVGPGRVAADFDETYLAGGYYAAQHPTLPDTTIIVLDDVLWSIWHRNDCGTTGLDGANAMMAWLEKQLAAGEGRRPQGLARPPYPGGVRRLRHHSLPRGDMPGAHRADAGRAIRLAFRGVARPIWRHGHGELQRPHPP